MDSLLDTFKVRVRIHEAGEAHEHSCQTNQAVQNGHEFRHLGHLHTLGQQETNGSTDQQCENQLDVVLRDNTENRRQQCDGHADDAVPVTPSSSFLVGQSAERQDEKNRGGDV